MPGSAKLYKQPFVEKPWGIHKITILDENINNMQNIIHFIIKFIFLLLVPRFNPTALYGPVCKTSIFTTIDYKIVYFTREFYFYLCRHITLSLQYVRKPRQNISFMVVYCSFKKYIHDFSYIFIYIIKPSSKSFQINSIFDCF